MNRSSTTRLHPEVGGRPFTQAEVEAMGLTAEDKPCDIQHVKGMEPHRHITYHRGPTRPTLLTKAAIAFHDDAFHDQYRPDDNCPMVQALAAIEAEVLSEASKAVAALPYHGGGHQDSWWSDAVGEVKTWHECTTNGLTHEDVIAAIRALRDGSPK